MRLCELPADVQRLVLQTAVGGALGSSGSWKHRLNLLAVCRMWRALALPMVYRNAYIYSSVYDKDGMHHDPVDGTESSMEGHAVATNVDLMGTTRCSRFVRAVEIELVHSVELEDYLGRVVKLLSSSGTEWSRVSTLKLRLFPRTASRDMLSIGALTYGRVIVRLLPGVRKLTIAGGSGDGQVCGLLGKLTDHYASQLEQLHGNTPAVLTAGTFSNELTYLRLGLDGFTQSLPHVNAGALRSLNLYGVCGRFSWTCFGERHAPTVIKFGNLRHLDVAYSSCFLSGDDDEEDGDDTLVDSNSDRGFEIYFPKLHKLRIVGCPRNCVLLQAGVFPEYLPLVRIYGPTSALALIDGSRLGRVGKLDVNLQSFDSSSYAEFYAHSNRVFGARGTGDNSFLYIGRQVLVDPEMVQWRRLERLLIMSPLKATSLVSLISKLPNVVSLVAFRTVMLDVQSACSTAMSCPGIGATNIERLGVVYDEGCTEDDAELLISHLLLNSRKLRSLTLPVWHMDVARTAVEHHKLQHPHVARVSLRSHL